MVTRRVNSRACVAVALVAGLAGCGRAGGQPFQPALNTPVQVNGDTVIGQTLNPPGDTITGLDLSIATFGASADPDGELTVTLRPVTASGPAVQARVDGSDISDGAWVTATFDPAAPGDGVVLAEMTWEGSTPLALWADVPLEDTEGIVNDPYPPGQLVIDGQPTQGDLAFRVRADGGLTAAARQLRQTLTTAGLRLLDQPVFFAIWLLGVIAMAWLAVTGFRPRRSHARRDRR